MPVVLCEKNIKMEEHPTDKLLNMATSPHTEESDGLPPLPADIPEWARIMYIRLMLQIEAMHVALLEDPAHSPEEFEDAPEPRNVERPAPAASQSDFVVPEFIGTADERRRWDADEYTPHQKQVWPHYDDWSLRHKNTTVSFERWYARVYPQT